MKKFTVSTLLVLGLLVSLPVYAHPGGTDASGGHYCRTNCAKWGLGQEEYHKHNAGGGYTNSRGQVYDKTGKSVSGSSSSSTTNSTSKPALTPTPTPAKPTLQPTAATPKAATPTPTRGEVMGTSEEVTPTPEPSPEPSPTPSSTPEETPSPTPTNSSTSDGGGSGGVVATLGTLVVLGGAGYYAYRRIKKRKG